MPLQLLLPEFPDGATRVNALVSILKKEGQITYFLGQDNYYSHGDDEKDACRYALAVLMENGHAGPSEVTTALGIAPRTLMNWGKQLREKGASSFFRPARHGGARVMTEEKVIACSGLFGQGLSIAEVARHAEVDASTLRKAVARGAVLRPEQDAATPAESVCVTQAPTKSDRSRQDAAAAAGLGMACTRADERVAAAMGLAGSAVTRFESGRDVAMGGLLTGLPALCENGLLSGLGTYMDLPRGFYSAAHILMTLGFMALGRIRRPEGLRHISPGELGKVVGLDRVPEVRTLREKIALMAHSGNPKGWMLAVSQHWMEADPDAAGYCYVDGHVRVYSGNKAHLPARYVSRDRLCLRGTTDYWVNDALGRPFFVVPKAVTDGLGTTLLEDIVPILLNSVPGQPRQEELDADPLLHRFVVVFDREGATPALLTKLWEQRIGAITYRKNVQNMWLEEEFKEVEATLPDGATTRMKLAIRQTECSSKELSVPVTEVRRLTSSGHQTAVITTARRLVPIEVASHMFARWCQENYFGYAMEHFDMDGLVEYGADELPGTTRVINPAWRNLDKQTKNALKTLRGLQGKLGAQPAPENSATLHKNAELVERIQAAETQYKQLRDKRKQSPRKVQIASLPHEQRPTALRPLNKTLTDTVKMIAYRAETAMAALLMPHLHNDREARTLIRELFVSTADIEPDPVARTLTVRIHHMTCAAHDKALAALLDDLTQLEFHHPETGQRIIYRLL